MNLTINGTAIEARKGSTILEAALENGIRIPTLCWLKDVNKLGACRLCVVEVKGRKAHMPACVTPVAEGMEVITDSEELRKARRGALELIASNHRMDCTDCGRGVDCELRALLREFGADDRAYGIGKRERIIDDSAGHLTRDNSRCILCRRCVATCRNVQGVGAIAVNKRGADTSVGFGLKLSDTDCVHCGQCVAACPTGALTVHDDTKPVWKALYDKEKTVVMALSNATAQRLGELFGEAAGMDVSGKIAAILHKIGFDLVVDSSTLDGEYRAATGAAVARKWARGIRPVLSADCPAWKNYISTFYPQLTENLAEVPVKPVWFARRTKEVLEGKKVFFVSIDNCTSLKAEIRRPENLGAVDAAITTWELFHLIRRACVSNFTANEVWAHLEPEALDTLPGAGERVLLNRREAFRESIFRLEAVALRQAETSGLLNAKRALEDENGFDYIKARACPGGCLFGGGAPRG